MRINKIIACFICLLAIAFYGCEYQLDQKNVVDLKEPAATHQLDLSMVSQGDTILIVDVMKLTFNLNTYGLNTVGGVVTCDKWKWSLKSRLDTIIVDPEVFSAGTYTMKATFYTHSGSGSMADSLNVEGYSINREWTIVVDGRTAPAITPTSRINSDGFLELSWSKCDQLNLQSYNVYKGSLLCSVLTNPNDTSFIDSTYVGGATSYRIDTKVYTKKKVTTGATLNMEKQIPSLHFETKGSDSLRVFWDKSNYRCKYHLAYGVGQSNYTHLYFNNDADTSVVIGLPAIGVQLSFYLHINPYYLDYNLLNDETEFKNYQQGAFLSSNFPEVGYNKTNRVYYSNSDHLINCYDQSTMTMINSYDPGESVVRYSCATNSGKMAAMGNQCFYVFDDKNLTTPIKINASGANSIYHFLLTDNNLVALSYPSKYVLYDITTKAAVAKLDIADYPTYSDYPKISTSQDAKYVCITSNNGLKLYKVENNAFNLIYSDARHYSSAYFNPLNPEELLLSFSDNNTVEVRSLPNFSIKKSMVFSANYHIENIDVESGYLLLNNYTNALIVNIQTATVLKHFNVTSWKYQLSGNVLFSKDGYYLDLSKQLAK